MNEGNKDNSLDQRIRSEEVPVWGRNEVGSSFPFRVLQGEIPTVTGHSSQEERGAGERKQQLDGKETLTVERTRHICRTRGKETEQSEDMVLKTGNATLSFLQSPWKMRKNHKVPPKKGDNRQFSRCFPEQGVGEPVRKPQAQ